MVPTLKEYLHLGLDRNEKKCYIDKQIYSFAMKKRSTWKDVDREPQLVESGNGRKGRAFWSEG